MNHQQMILIEKAFTSFVNQLKRKNDITVHYYKLKKANRDYDCSYLGYATNTDGLFGIHYNKTINNYYFGARNKKAPSTLFTLTYNQINEIPSTFKNLLVSVSTSKNNKSIRKV